MLRNALSLVLALVAAAAAPAHAEDLVEVTAVQTPTVVDGAPSTTRTTPRSSSSSRTPGSRFPPRASASRPLLESMWFNGSPTNPDSAKIGLDDFDVTIVQEP